MYVVTTLDWDGPGSLSEALLATEPRIVVFRVSGVIDVPGGGVSALTEASSYVTVAGQTSPGGITLRGAQTTLESYHSGFHDGVFRFLRFRGNGNYDNLSFNDTHHLVFDHCDNSGAEDEAFDITFSHDFTLSCTTITNSGPEGAAPEDGAKFDYRNNVIYDCAFEKGLDVSAPVVDSGYPGLAYDPDDGGRVVAWNGGDTVYSLDLDTAAWTAFKSVNGPGKANESGTYKRWRFVGERTFLLVNGYDQNAYSFRM